MQHLIHKNKFPLIAVTLLAIIALGVWYLHYPHLSFDTSSDTNAIFTVASSTGDNYLVVTNDGRVGIGAGDPHAMLEVHGAIRLTSKSPDGCSPSTEGSIAYNPDNKHFWGCDGGTWRQLDNN